MLALKILLSRLCFLLLASFILVATGCKENDKPKPVQASTLSVMPMFVIEREVPGAGKMDQQQLKDLSQKSCDILRQMGSDIEWDHSYVTEDKIYCVYRAKDSSLIRKHALLGHFPANKITIAGTIISPKTAEMEIKE